MDSRRTSLIVVPPTGRLPDKTEAAKRLDSSKGPKGFDNPEEQALSERCVVPTFTNSESSIGGPMLPNPLYSNY